MDFTLSISLGSAAMRRTSDVAAALRDAADRIESSPSWRSDGDDGGIKDANGNTVGGWKTEPVPTIKDFVTETAASLGPGDDSIHNLLTALESVYMNGVADEQHGDVDGPTGFHYRVSRFVVAVDSDGGKTIFKHALEADAETYMEGLS